MRKHEQTEAGPSYVRFALVVSILAIAVITLTPKSGANSRELVPFDELAHTFKHPFASEPVAPAVNAIGNLLLFMPLGGALAFLAWSSLRAVVFGCAFSTSIELAQLFVPGRTSATDDILLNTTGTFIGYALAAAYLRRIT